MHAVLICVASFVLLCDAASMQDGAVSLLLRSQGPAKVDTKTLVASLGEVAKGLQTEDKKAFTLSQQSKSACKKTDMAQQLAMNKGKRASDIATDAYKEASAQVTALELSLSNLKGQISSSNRELDSLQAKLKKMRKEKGLLKKGASGALRQVEAVIARTYLRDSNDHRSGQSALEKDSASLEEMSKGLSFLQSESADEARTFQKAKVARAHAPVMILKADKQVVVQASDATQRGFNEEESKIIQLIQVERKKLQDLEDNLQDVQPAISNKLKQTMEINRTLVAARRGVARDKVLMAIEKKKCVVIADNLAAQKKKRGTVINDVSMASKVLQHMDARLFLAQDLQGLRRVSPSFLQMDDELSMDDPPALLQERESTGLEVLAEESGSATMTGPFDGVTNMIGGLVASLKAQANQEVNQHQFCQDSLSKNRRDRIAKKSSMDTLTSTIRWSKIAIVRLDDDQKYIDGEVRRLQGVRAAEANELVTEKTRVSKELAEHKLADEVITKVVVILNQLCDLKGALLQGSGFTKCGEAAKLLTSASKGVRQLNTITQGYLKTYTTLSGSIGADAKSAENARTTELKSTNAARAQRALELATAVKDRKETAKELILIDKSEKQLEHSCSHIETREEKMARRTEEIDALKEALTVLNGEGIP